jgi:hypothetical protein
MSGELNVRVPEEVAGTSFPCFALDGSADSKHPDDAIIQEFGHDLYEMARTIAEWRELGEDMYAAIHRVYDVETIVEDGVRYNESPYNGVGLHVQRLEDLLEPKAGAR